MKRIPLDNAERLAYNSNMYISTVTIIIIIGSIWYLYDWAKSAERGLKTKEEQSYESLLEKDDGGLFMFIYDKLPILLVVTIIGIALLLA